MMSPVVLFLVSAFIGAASAMSNPMRANAFTPLKNDEHPCVAENLKVSNITNGL